MRALLPVSALIFALVAVLAAPTAPATADVLELTDGRLVEGVVVKLADEYLVRSRYGDTVVKAADVKAHLEAQPVDQQVRAHLAKLADDDAENRALLARWLQTIGREDEARAMAAAVLDLDPESAVAHEVLGHVRHRGAWRTPDEAKQADGFEKHGDRWYTPQEWANQGTSVRDEALERERRAEAARLQVEVNRAVKLMMSPDATLRARGLARLQAMAREYENPSLAELAKHVAAYVEKLDEVQAGAGVASGLSPTVGANGYVTGEFRATLSRLKRPIQEFATSLASNIGGAPVRIQLPEMEVIRVRTTGIIPVAVK
jgi:hypothetical protein